MHIIALHRGRNAKTSLLFKSITQQDYNFDFRGFNGGSVLNPLWLLLKAWITAREVPKADAYLIEGGLVFWVGWFLKRRYPSARLLLMVPEPAFWCDPAKGSLQKAFYRFRMHAIRTTVSWMFPICKMVAEDAHKECGFPLEQMQPVPHPILDQHRFDRLVPVPRGQVVVFIIDRPNDTGFVKGLDRALVICEKAHQYNPDMRLLLVGAGCEELPIDRPWIEKKGHAPIEEIMARAKVLIAPARYDAFLLVVGEAVLSGVIPLVSDKVGIKERLGGDAHFLQIAANTPEVWSEQLLRCLTMSDEERLELIEKLRPYFLDLTEAHCIEQFKSAVLASVTSHELCS